MEDVLTASSKVSSSKGAVVEVTPVPANSTPMAPRPVVGSYLLKEVKYFDEHFTETHVVVSFASV